jgi:6-phosphogluconolactonase
MAQTFAYVGNAETQDVSGFRLQDNGDLIPVETKSIPGPAKPGFSTPMAVSPDKRFLFVGLRNEPYSVVTFHIDPAKGTLTFVGSGPLADQMAYLSTDGTGRFLFAASYQGSKVTVSPIADGGIVGVTHQIVATKPSAHCIVPTRSNRHVLHTSLGGDVVHQQTFDAAKGTLAPNDPYERPVRAKAGPRHIVFSNDETRAYLMNELDGSIYVFPFDAGKGTLGTELQIVSAVPAGITEKPSGADIHLTPNGKFLYASERASNTLAAFRVISGGKLEPAGNYPTETTPRGFNIDPSGRYLYAVGQASHSMTSYAIDQTTGALTVLKKHAVGKNPNWIEFVAFS